MKIPRSWKSFFIVGPLRPRGHRTPTLADRVAAAVASARARIGIDESLDDLAADGDFRAHLKAQGAAIRAFAAAHEAALLLALVPDTQHADPILAAALRMFPAPANVDAGEHAERVIDLHRQLASLTVDNEVVAEVMAPRPAHRPKSRDPVIEAVVRAAMHHLHESGYSYSGGWHYGTRVRGRAGMRSDAGELTSARAARLVGAVVKAVIPTAKDPEIKGHMVTYVKLLRAQKRPPEAKDYVYVDEA